MKGQEPVPAAPSPWEIVQDSLKPFRAADLEGSLAYWAHDAVIRLIGAPPGQPDTFAGKEQVRAWFESLFAIHFEIHEELIKVERDTVTVKALSWSDPMRQLGVAPLEATEVYVVKNGKIKSLMWTITPDSAAKLQAAISRT